MNHVNVEAVENEITIQLFRRRLGLNEHKDRRSNSTLENLSGKIQTLEVFIQLRIVLTRQRELVGLFGSVKERDMSREGMRSIIGGPMLH